MATKYVLKDEITKLFMKIKISVKRLWEI